MNKSLFILVLVVGLLMYSNLGATDNNVFEVTVNKPMTEVYPKMIESVEASRFYIFYEMDIGKNLAFFADRWGTEYNQHDLSAIRSIVFCNGWYLNKAGNKDPNIHGLCPMHQTLIEKEGKTTALFVRPTVTYKESPAYNVVVDIEKEVIAFIENGMQ